MFLSRTTFRKKELRQWDNSTSCVSMFVVLCPNCGFERKIFDCKNCWDVVVLMNGRSVSLS